MELKTFIDFFSGIGGGRLGLEMCGLQCVGHADTSRNSNLTYDQLFDVQSERNFRDIKKIRPDKLPDYDIFIGGFPCQSYSVIGRQKGLDDKRGQLIYYVSFILSVTSPKCFILENVKGLVSHGRGETLKTIIDLLEKAGYNVTYKVLNSLDFGVPHMRQRVYIVGVRKDINCNIKDFEFPAPSINSSLSDFLVEHQPASDIDIEYFKKYLVNETNNGKYSYEDILNMEGRVIDSRMNDLRIYENKVPTLRSQRDGIFYIHNHTLCALTGYEALLLQGFPKEYADKVKDTVSDRHLLLQAGNAMTVNVIREIGKELKAFLGKDDNV